MIVLTARSLQLVLCRDSPFPGRGASHLIKYYGATEFSFRFHLLVSTACGAGFSLSSRSLAPHGESLGVSHKSGPLVA